MIKPIAKSLVILLFAIVRLDADGTKSIDVVQLDGFSTSYKINDPYSWRVKVSDDRRSIEYQYAYSSHGIPELPNSMPDVTGGLAEFSVSRVAVSAKLRGESADRVADEIIRKDVGRTFKNTYDPQIALRLNKTEKYNSAAGDVTFYINDRILMRRSSDLRKLHGNFHAYAALILPDDYALRGVAYVVTGVELSGSVMERPIHLEKFRALISGLKEDAETQKAVAPAIDIYQEPLFTGKYYNVNDVDTPPVARGRHKKAAYPADLRERKITGSAVVSFIVDTDGYARQVQVGYATHKEFAESASKAAERWRFQPARKNGAAVNCAMHVPVPFNLIEAEVVSEKKVIEGSRTTAVKGEESRVSQTDSPPKVISRKHYPRPRDPSSFIKRGIFRGEALITLIVDKKGNPRDVQIEKTDCDEFAAEAIKAVKTWKFAPGIKGGAPVECRVQLPFAFSLEG